MYYDFFRSDIFNFFINFSSLINFLVMFMVFMFGVVKFCFFFFVIDVGDFFLVLVFDGLRVVVVFCRLYLVVIVGILERIDFDIISIKFKYVVCVWVDDIVNE